MDPEARKKLSVAPKDIPDAAQASSWSEATSPTATITTVHTMQSQQESSPEPPRTPPATKSKRLSEEGEHDSTSVLTPSQPLHDKLGELEQKWSDKRSSRRDEHFVFAAGGRILHKPSKQQTASPSTSFEQRTPVRKKTPAVEIEFSSERRSVAKQSVFDRLYQQSSTPSRKRRPTGRDGRTFRSMPMPATPQSSSVEGTVSTLSSTESVFDRLYKNEKRKRVDIPRASRSVASTRDVIHPHPSDSMSAAASLERRLSYAAPLAKRRNRVSSSGKVASLIQQHESRKAGRSQPGTPQSHSSRSPRKSGEEQSVSSNADSVFERLYRREKRKTPVLSERSTVRPVKNRGSPQSSTRSHRSTARLPPDSVFERLYKGEKRKSPLTAKTRQNAARHATTGTNQSPSAAMQRSPAIDTRIQGDADSFRSAKILLEDSLRSSADSDDSLLHEDLPAPTVLSFGAYSTYQQEIVRSDANSIGDTLARLKLQLYVRRIQRCVRAYLASSSRQGKAETATTRQSCICTFAIGEDTAAVIIQSAWRAHHCRLMTIASLLQTCQIDCDFRGSGGSGDYSENALLQMRIHSFAKVMGCAGDTRFSAMQVYGRKVKIVWRKEGVIYFRNKGGVEMETAAVTLKCTMIRPSFTLKWSSHRFGTMVVKAALLEAYVRDSEQLAVAYASVIQSWVRMILEKKRGSSRRLGRVPPIRTCGLEYLAQYLTPTSLQHQSAITLQNAWRFHQAQVRAADVMLTDWRVACDLSDVSDNRILAMMVRLNALVKAVGRVDCWWITEGVIVGGEVVSVNWNRDIGVHFTDKGVPKLESYTVQVDCEAIRTAFVEHWSRRKLAILVVKATLNRAIACDRCHLVDTSATLIQTWFRRTTSRILFLRQVSRLHARLPNGGLKSLQRHDLIEAECLKDKSSFGICFSDANESLPPQFDNVIYAATVIQSIVRRYLRISLTQRRKEASSRIQCFVRRQQARRTIQAQNAAATVIQSSLLQLHQQRTADRKRQSAVTIQSCWRSASTRDAYAELKRAATVIQTWERRRQSVSFCLAMHEARKIESRIVAVSVIQSMYRGTRARNQASTERRCATMIQNTYRRYVARSHFRTVILGVVALQAAYRGIMSRHLISLWHALVVRSRSALLVQSLWRGSQVRQRYVSIRNNAIVVQSCYRKHRAMCDLQMVRRGILALQARQRGASCRSRIHLQQIASATLQRAYRGSKSRANEAFLRDMALSEEAATRIQNWYRCWGLRSDYLALRHAAIEIQKFERRRKCIVTYQRLLHQLISFQALCRGMIARNAFLLTGGSAKLIQTTWRRSYHQKFFMTCRKSAETLQSVVRRMLALRLFQKVLVGIISLQAHCRGQMVRCNLLRQSSAAVTLQAQWRKQSAAFLLRMLREDRRREQSAMRSQATESAAVLIQGCWRRYYLRHNFMMLKHFATQIQSAQRCRQPLVKYQCLRRGIIRLQARSRGALSRQMLVRLAEATVIIQRYQRGLVLRQHFLALKHFIIKIQTAVRRRQALSMYSRVVRGTIRLQACHRGITARQGVVGESIRVDAAATLIQKFWRSYYRQKIFLSMRRAALQIQANERRRRCLVNLTLLLCGIVRLQALYRGFETRNVLKRRIESNEVAALLIQSFWRRYCCQRRYLAMRRIAVRLQAQYRGVLLRQLLTELAAAVILQSMCRSLVPRRQFLACKQATLCIQAGARRHLCRSRYTRVTNGLTLLQAHCRGVMARQMVNSSRQAASRVQSSWRASLECRRYRLIRKAVRATQLAFRRHRAQRQFYTVHKGMNLLQALQRGRLQRHAYEKQRRSAKAIQTIWVQYRLRSCSRLVSFAAGSTTSLVDLPLSRCTNYDGLGSPCQPSMKLIHDAKDLAALAIQARWRSFLALRFLREMDASARLIQVKFFTWKMQLTLLMVQSSVVLLQRSVRGQLLRSAARFALSHINASLRSPVITSFQRITKNSDTGVAFIWLTWNKSVSKAREAASVVIQSAFRRGIAKRYCGKLRSDRPMVTFRHILGRKIKSISSGVSSKGRVYAQRPQRLTVHQQESKLSAVDTVDVSSTEPPSHARPKPVLQPDRTNSAIVIQRALREYLAFNEVRTRDLSACRIQKVYRQRLETMKYTRFRGGLVSLQSRYRGAHVRSTFSSMTGAAIHIQKVWRMHRDQRHYNLVLRVVCLLQNRHRMRIACRSFQMQKEAIRVIQERVRVHQRGTRVRMEAIVKKRAILRLQQEWRMQRERRRFLSILQLALLLQARHRMRLMHHSFCARKKAACVIQSQFRAWQQGASVRSDMALQSHACTQLQRTWRLYRDCRRYLAMCNLALLLQATCRMHHETRSFQDQKKAALILQTSFRRWNQRAAYSNLIEHVIKLQAVGRQFLARMALQKAIFATVAVQRVWRGAVLRRKLASSIPYDVESDAGLTLDENPAASVTETISTLDREKITECVQEYLVSLTDSKSKSEANRLVSGDTARLDNSGPCIQRLVHRVMDAQDKAAAIASNLEKRAFAGFQQSVDDGCAIDTDDASKGEGESLVEDIIDATSMEQPRPDPEAVTTLHATAEVSSANGESRLDAQDALVANAEHQSPSSNTLDLAMEAQKLLLEARRARVKFQKARTGTPASVSWQQSATSSPGNQESTTDATQPETHLFGDTAGDDLPSPIKLEEEEEWDWANNWK